MSKALQHLEKLSQERPADAIRRAETMVLEVEDRLVPKVLAICGTAYRRLERHDDALHVLLDAENLTDDLPTLADIKQRIAYVIAATGELDRAIRTILVAQNLFLICDDRSGLGRALVDQGMFCYHQGDLRSSKLCLNRSLELLSEDEPRHRFSALVGLGLCHAEESIEEALDYLDRAALQAARVGKALQWKLLWSRARLLEQHDLKLEALELFRTLAEEYLFNDHLLDACLAIVDLIRATQELGENPKALAKLVGQLAFALPERGIAADAVSVMFFCCARGQVQQDILDRVKQAVQQERRQSAAAC